MNRAIDVVGACCIKWSDLDGATCDLHIVKRRHTRFGCRLGRAILPGAVRKNMENSSACSPFLSVSGCRIRTLENGVELNPFIGERISLLLHSSFAKNKLLGNRNMQVAQNVQSRCL